MHEHLLEIDGHRLAALTANENLPGTPVVFIHGITASVDFWTWSLPPAVRDSVPWISLSLPGHAPSRLRGGYRLDEITPEMFARVHENALRQLVGDRAAALVGWSTGGFSVLNLAAHHPGRARSVMSIAGFARGPWHGQVGLMQRLARAGRVGRAIFRAIFSRLAKSRRLFDWSICGAAANRAAFRASPVTRPTLDGWRAALGRHDLHALADLFRRLAEFDITGLLGRIRAPTLIVSGDGDPYIRRSHATLMTEAIPGARLAVLENTGHMFFAENTAGYHRVLIDWLNATAGYSLRAETASTAVLAGA